MILSATRFRRILLYVPRILLYFPTILLNCPRNLVYFPRILLYFPRILLHFPMNLLYFPRILLYVPWNFLYFPRIFLYFPTILLYFLRFFARLTFQWPDLLVFHSISYYSTVTSATSKCVPTVRTALFQTSSSDKSCLNQQKLQKPSKR